MLAKEKELIQYFETLYPTSLPLTKNMAFLEFVLNKHNYGQHVRILDFSKSLYVALWFAMNGEAKESSIYAINKVDLVLVIHLKIMCKHRTQLQNLSVLLK